LLIKDSASAPWHGRLHKALTVALLALGLSTCWAAPVAQSPSAPADALRRIEHLAERNPNRAVRKLSAWLETAPPLAARERLRIEVIRAEIAGALESSDAALERVDRLLPRLVESGDAGLQARALALRVRLLDFLNRGAEALAESAVAFERALDAGAAELQVEILVNRAGVLATRADFGAAYAALDEAQRLARQVASQRAEGNVAYYAGWLASAVGDRARTVEMFERALVAYRNDEDVSSVADTLVGVGLALIRDRRPKEALAPLDEATRAFEQMEDERGVAIAESPRSVALAALGRSADALRASDRALAILRPHGSAEEMLFALLNRAQMANLLERRQVAMAALDEVRPHAQATENALARITYLRESAVALAALGRFKEAHAALAELVRREDAHNEQRLSRQLAAQRGQLESQRLERDNDLLRREAEANRKALAALERATRLRSALVVLAGLVVMATLYGLWWQRRVNRRIAALAATDHLTGTFNRRRIGEIGNEAFAAFRSFGAPLSVALLDLDHFKQINDQHGHATGDAALRAVADALAAQLRGTDRLGRYGGEEFAVVLPRADATEAVAVVERLRVAVAGLQLAQLGVQERLTLSAGVAAANKDDRNFGDVLHRADMALYRAKEGGRNCVHVAAQDAPVEAEKEAAE
jgi:diguanylate cyclase (GGDEF)-like protein